MELVEIHEFSTGITYEVRDGQWISTGFTVGKYMNNTLDSIPNCVQQAIRNNWFEVSKNRESQEPTIVGRVVPGDRSIGESDWSVVAIATPGVDDYGRYTAFYRYFLCEGADSLWKVVAWLEYYRRNNYWPVYKPYEAKSIGQPTQYDCVTQKQPLTDEWRKYLNKKTTPVILPYDEKYEHNLTFINAMAEYKAKGNNIAISWVWNVEAIEELAYFTIIDAADKNAYDLLKKASQAQASKPILALAAGLDDAAITSSIRGLIDGGKLEPQWMPTIVRAKQENRLTQQHWEKIFDDFGAKSGSISPNIVRLLTLRAILWPETLPEYLEYLKIRKGKSPNQQQETSLEFQSKLGTKERDSLKGSLFEGATEVANSMYAGRMELVPAVAWLFDYRQGLWSKYRDNFIAKVKENFRNLGYRDEYKPLEKLFKDWGKELYHYSFVRGGENYDNTDESFIDTIRRRVNSNQIEFFFQALLLLLFISLLGNWEVKLYVLMFAVFSVLFRIFLNKEQKQIDKVYKIVFGTIYSLVIGLIALVGTQFIPWVAAQADRAIASWKGNPQQRRPKPTVTTTPDPTEKNGSSASSNGGKGPTPSPGVTVPPSSDRKAVNMTLRERQVAIKNFSGTRQALKTIVSELQGELPQLRLSSYSNREEQQKDEKARKNIVIAALRETLGSQFDLQYGSAIDPTVENPNKQEHSDKWIEAIYLYQKERIYSTKGFGYILPSTQTTINALKEDIKSNNLFRFAKKTRPSLSNIVEVLRRNFVTTSIRFEDREIAIKNKIKEALEAEQLDYSLAAEESYKNGGIDEIKKLTQAIQDYQANNDLPSDGIIDPGGDTFKDLKERVRQLLREENQSGLIRGNQRNNRR